MIKAGSLIAVEAGGYSDLEVVGFFVASQDFDPEAIAAEILAEDKAKAKAADEAGLYYDEWGTIEKYVPELARRGLILDIPYANLYLGGAGRLNLEVTLL